MQGMNLQVTFFIYYVYPLNFFLSLDSSKSTPTKIPVKLTAINTSLSTVYKLETVKNRINVQACMGCLTIENIPVDTNSSSDGLLQSVSQRDLLVKISLKEYGTKIMKLNLNKVHISNMQITQAIGAFNQKGVVNTISDSFEIGRTLRSMRMQRIEETVLQIQRSYRGNLIQTLESLTLYMSKDMITCWTKKLRYKHPLYIQEGVVQGLYNSDGDQNRLGIGLNVQCAIKNQKQTQSTNEKMHKIGIMILSRGTNSTLFPAIGLLSILFPLLNQFILLELKIESKLISKTQDQSEAQEKNRKLAFQVVQSYLLISKL